MMRRFSPSFFSYTPEIIAPSPEPSRLFYEPLSFTDLEGQQMQLSDTKSTLLVFWASWCKPCLDEIPMINDLYKKHDDLQVISINLDEISDQELKNFIAKNNITYPVIPDPEASLQGYFNVTVLPSNIMLDKDLKEKWRIVGNNETAFKNHLEILQ